MIVKRAASRMAMNCVEEIGVIEVMIGHGIAREGVIAYFVVFMLSVYFILFLATCVGNDAFSIDPTGVFG